MELVYEILAAACLLLFAGHDIRHKRVPNRALVFFCGFAVAAPAIRTWASGGWALLPGAVAASSLGAAAAFAILFLAAMVSKGGAGVGGGDIKLLAVMGFIYGPARISLLLLVASFLAAAAAGAARAAGREGRLSLPFVPFLAAGGIAVIMVQIIR